MTKQSYVYLNILINEIKSRENLKRFLEVIDISGKDPLNKIEGSLYCSPQFRKNYTKEGQTRSNDKMATY